jgi:hypothetical protein
VEAKLCAFNTSPLQLGDEELANARNAKNAWRNS